MDTRSTLPNQACQVGTDAIILLGATCGGPQEYAQVAAELGYGPLIMPKYCDFDSIRNQLLRAPQYADRQ